MKLKSIFTIVVVMAATAAMAQGQAGAARQARAGAQRGGNNGVMGLLRRADVQTELKLSSDQKDKLTALMPQRGQGGGQGGGQRRQNGQGQGPDRAAMQAQQAEMQKKINEILDDSQEKRLAELMVQRMGNRAIFDQKVAEKLGVTEDQKAKVAALRSKQRDAQQALMEKTRSQEITREEAQAARLKNEAILDEEIGKILTDKQKSDLRAMGGAPFKFEETL